MLLAQPGMIGPLRLRNRVVMAPMGTNSSSSSRRASTGARTATAACSITGRGCLAPYSRPIKRAVSVPVLVAVRLVDPEDAEAVLREVVATVEAAGVPYALVGDCYRPGDFLTCLRDAWMVALSVDRRFREARVPARTRVSRGVIEP